MSEKITSRHIQRRALVYVRQSSYQQLLHNVESRRLQYAMEERVRDLGWNETEVIDEAQGRSARRTIGRTGLQRLWAEEGLGKVGAAAGVAGARFERSAADERHLVEVRETDQAL